MEYSLVSLATLVENGQASEYEEIYDQQSLDVPPPLFERSLPPAEGRNVTVARSKIGSYLIKEAVVHTEYGIITVGSEVLAESLQQMPFHLTDWSRNDEVVSFPPCVAVGRIGVGAHLMGGNYLNHYHWLLEILPRLQGVPPFSVRSPTATIITSTAKATQIQEIVGYNQSLIALPTSGRVMVDRLIFVPDLSGAGFTPHPGLNTFFRRLKHIVDPNLCSIRPERRIYISRIDSKNRPMINEGEVISLMKSMGYEILTLTGLSLKEQISLFASSGQIIGAHGAGMANLVFCAPSAVVCEFHLSNYLNWCMRNMAAVSNVNYGCILGHPIDPIEGSKNKQQWRVDLNAVLNVAKQMSFIQRGSQ